MKCKRKYSHLPLKKMYYGQFLGLIVIPLFMVLVIALLILNQQFKKQALENIDRAQDTVIAELLSDVDVMSMRLSHIIYTNDSEVLSYAAGTAVSDADIRHKNEQKLARAVDLILEPVTDVISLNFAMHNGRTTNLKAEITRPRDEIRESIWYQNALKNKNKVYIGSYDTKDLNDLYLGSRKDTMVLVFALSPDVITDPTNQIEMVTFYQTTGASEQIKKYNRAYLAGENKLGTMQIVDETGDVIYATGETEEYDVSEYTCVTSEITLPDTRWYVKSYIRTPELTADFWETAGMVLAVAVLIFLLESYFSSYFLRSIIHPVEEISAGLKQIEEGNLDVHIVASGQYEIRTMIHQFNAMGRRLKALIAEYEEKVRSAGNTPEDYFKAVIAGRMTPQEAEARTGELFKEPYILLKFYVPDFPKGEDEAEKIRQLKLCFDRNPRFASRCMVAAENAKEIYVHYRIMEEEYRDKLLHMLHDLQSTAEHEQKVSFVIAMGQRSSGVRAMYSQMELLKSKMGMYHLYGKNALLDFDKDGETLHGIYENSARYTALVKALYIADDKNMVVEREKLFTEITEKTLQEAKAQVCAVVLAIARYFDEENTRFSEVFGQDYNYIEKIERLTDMRSLKLWVTNYFAWLMDYSASKLNILETDVIVKAKRYMADNYENPELTLSSVAEYIGLNEKYFSNRFTKETGETFSAYLTELRLQKAKELLGSTNFKIYEIAEMIGYHNAEHFNRMFKKYNGISPAQYRKTM